MGFDQYHEPPDELPEQTRTFARLCASLTEEAEAIGWYEQRLAIEQRPGGQGGDGRRGRRGVQALQHGPRVPAAAHAQVARDRPGVLFQQGDIVEHGEAAEAAADDDGDEDSAPTPASAAAGGGSLGIGSLRGEGL